MNFRPEMVDLILAGKKREDWRERCRLREGRSYVLQSGCVTKDERITITKIEPWIELGSMTLRQAKRAGYKTTLEARDHWREMHGSYDPALRVFVISFTLGDHTDTPRLLAARPGAPHGDYVDSSARALKGEPEAIPATLQARYAGEARQTSRIIANGSLSALLERHQAVVTEIRKHATDPRVNENLRGLERQTASMRKKLSA
jgi:hypothetical protein